MSRNGPIICVEDDEDDQFVLREIFQSLEVPNEIRFFPNGKEALDYLETTNEKPFLILCDINMPLLNGIELRHRIVSSDFLRRKSIPFVFLTTTATYEILCQAYDAAVQGFYQKQTQFDEQLRQIGMIVEYWKTCLHPNTQF